MLSTDSLGARAKVVTTTRLNLSSPKTSPPATDAKQLTSIQHPKIFRKNPFWAVTGEVGLARDNYGVQHVCKVMESVKPLIEWRKQAPFRSIVAVAVFSPRILAEAVYLGWIVEMLRILSSDCRELSEAWLPRHTSMTLRGDATLR